MNKIEEIGDEKEFLSNPEIIENYSFLQGIGVFKYIDSLNREIRNYKSLYTGVLEIFNQNSIDEIMDSTVWQMSDHFLPTFIVFLWKPLQNKEEIVVKSYRNYKLIDFDLKIESFGPFETFFMKYPRPINFDLLALQMENEEALKTMEALHPEIIVPILGPSGLYGLVLIGHKILENDYTTQELVFLQRLMSFVSQAIQNHLHYERTLRDIKTGLYNNAFFVTRLNEEIARAKRTNSSSSIIMIDVDKFKRFNDNCGHLAGDRVLEYLALTIKEGVRTEDVPSRFGGEEFTVLLPDSEREAAWVVAERLRKMVAAMIVPWDPPLPRVTISLGIFTFNGEMELPTADVITRADEALYLSKERGRNRTTIWGSGLMARIEQLNIFSREITEP